MTALNDPRPLDEADAVDSAKRLDPLRRLAFLEMTDADAVRLQGMAADFQGWADDMVEVFYRHLFAFEETAKFLKSSPIVKRLKQVQREHFESMLEADWNEIYFQQRLQVGHVHAEMGIEPQYFLGAFNQYVKHSLQKLAIAQEEEGGYLEQALAVAPRFHDDAESLLRQHGSMLQQVDQVVATAKGALVDENLWRRLQVQVKELLKNLIAHETAENQIVQQALNTGIEAD